MFTNREIAELPEEKQIKLLKLIEEKGTDYGVFPLSAEQERMWFLYQLDTNNPYYNGITALEFNGVVKEENIYAALKKVIDRQTILRTIYITIQGKSYQVVLDDYVLPFETIQLAEEEEEQKKQIHKIVSEENGKPFDLTEEIPIKAIFLKRGQDKSTLLVKMHHICSDGWSYGILVQEFKEAYTQLVNQGTKELAPLPYRYGDYGIWQKKMMETEQYSKQIHFWEQKLKGCKEEISFCFEKEEKEKKNRGGAIGITLEQEELEQLKRICKENHTSVYTVTLALYFWNLWNYTGQDSINIGTPVANRQKEEYEKTIGYFANTLVLRADMKKEMTFQELLNQVKETTVDAMSNQDVPFDKLVDALGIERSSNMTPLFQIMFSLRSKTLVSGDMMEEEKLPDATMSFHTMGADYVDYIQFKMILTMTQYDDRMMIDLGYNKDIFDKEYMQWFMDDYMELLRCVMKGENLTLSEPVRNRADYQLKPVKTSYLPSELVVEAEDCQAEDEAYAYDSGLLNIVGKDGKSVLPGRVGNIIAKPEGSDTWFRTGDQGYWNRTGDIEITYRKHEVYSLAGLQRTVEAFEKRLLQKTSITECVITVPEEEKTTFMIYYTGSEELTNETFCNFLTEEEQQVQVESIRLLYIPLKEDGTYDTKRLDEEIYQGLKNNQQVSREAFLNELCKKARNQKKDKILNFSALYHADSVKEEEREESESRELSYAYGGDLEELPFYTLRDLLERQAERYGEKKIRFIQYNEEETHITYAQLNERAKKVAQGLYEKGVRKGDKVIMMSRKLDLFIQTLWGLITLGAIPVPLGPVKLINNEADAAVDKFKKVYGKLVHPIVLTSEEEEDDVKAVGEAFEMHIKSLWTMESLPSEIHGSTGMEEYRTELDEKDTAIILFTSGSTGMPKGVELCHRNILKRSQATTIYNRQTDKDISLNWMPLDHVGGVVMFHIRDVFGGIEQIQVETAEIVKDPLLWMDYVNKYRVNLTWAPNFAYGLLVQKKNEIKNYDWDLSCLRFILNGGELIQEKSSLEFLKVLRSKGLSQDAMYPSWGMSETSSGVLFSRYFGKRNYNGYVEVGEPIPGDEFRIVDDENQIVPQGVVGSLQIRGETVTKGYYDAMDTNRESFAEGGWFITGDLAIMRENQITLTGRNNDLIIINGVNYTCTEIENAGLEAAPALDVVVAIGVTGKTNVGEKLAVFYVNESEEADKDIRKKLRQGIFEKFGLQVDILIALKQEEVPRGALEKVQRKKMKQRYQDGLYNERIEQVVEKQDNWFYETKWTAKDYGILKKTQEETYLIFADRCGMLKEAGRLLAENGNQCFYVQAGTENMADGDTFTICAEEETSYAWLFWNLQEKGITVTSILHGWTYTPYGEISFEQAQKQGIYSIKAILTYTEQESKGCRVIVYSNYVNAVGEKAKVMPEKATLTGFLRSAKLEMSKTQLLHVDFDGENGNVNGRAAVYECWQEISGADIAYQNGIRLRMNIQQIPMTEKDELTAYMKQDGVYVVTGGLGGIGHYLSQYLLKQYHAQLILMGRSCLEADEEKQCMFERLKSLGTVTYKAVDISVPNAFSKAVSEVEETIGRKADGIFHLAGALNLGKHYEQMTNHLIVNETSESYEKMFQAKVKGTNEIFAFAKERENLGVVSFSSCNGIFGGNSFSAYSAANSYLDAKTYQMQQVTGAPYVNINWSMWEQTGMSESIDENMSSISVSMGYQLITPDLGMPSLECLLQRGIGHAIVGVDGRNANMSQKYQSDYYLNEVQKESDAEEILTEMESKVRKVWEEILGHNKFSKSDKFFEIGGNSIMSIQLAAAMNKISPVKIEVVDLFKYTSVEQLAAYMEEVGEETKNEEDAGSDLIGLTF